jgi:hypothetical protein
MTKYLIYDENNKKPIRKTKHENDAFLFVSDFKNLQQYGCMTVVREDDDGSRCAWDADSKAWIMEDNNG